MKKSAFIFFVLFALQKSAAAQSVGIGTDTPHPSSLLELSGNSKGILIPRMTMLQRNAITNPAEGLMVYQIDETIGFWYYTNGGWLSLTNSQVQQNTDEKIRRIQTRLYSIQ
jgi:hypothetical protein